MNPKSAQIKKIRKRKLAFIQEFKKNPCTDCGNTFHPEAMHFDHIRDKVIDISKMLTRSNEKILEEINKCELVCANCHAVRTYNRRWRVVQR